ncbi:85/88 kDa calcium-independent phospholipase A2-like [Limulus polyphemus]|uniref:phospholipase A2 n=1 Tax=Limulus polyphemus TaxID=6850 RepID=A0ABM1BH02_LIMPO|nr:85/88 kDa calcium-independent phospholipase A2-like [Limulus polyphemus]
MSIIRSLLERVVYGTTDNEFKVIEVDPENYVFSCVLFREDCLVLYYGNQEGVAIYDVVLHADVKSFPHTAFSLHRSSGCEKSQNVYLYLKDKLPIIVQASPGVLSVSKLQELSNLIRNNTGWSVAHIAVHFSLLECFDKENFVSMVNAVCEETLVTPLHLAVKLQNVSAIETLLRLNARVDLTDKSGNTVYHYAAAASKKEIIQALRSFPSPAVINTTNGDGWTPLHISCMVNNMDCVKELLLLGADPNVAACPSELSDGTSTTLILKERLMRSISSSSKSPKDGGLPLHLANSVECIETLIENGSHVNARNLNFDTPLHLLVQSKETLSSIICLLSHGADVNLDGSEGETPLHLAVKTGYLPTVHALLSFGANVNAVSHRQETPRHLAATTDIEGKELLIYTLNAVGAERCSKHTRSCNDGCSPRGTFDGVPPECSNLSRNLTLYDHIISAAVVNAALTRKQFGTSSLGSFDVVDSHIDQYGKKTDNLLCLDGGGIRGLILIRILMELETCVGCDLVKCFDWIAGTSTGGILALALAQGKKPKECLQLYFRLKDKVFVGSRPYDSQLLDQFLKKELGEDTVMTDIRNVKVTVTAVLADRLPAQLHLFRNYRSPDEILGVKEDGLYSQFFMAAEEQKVWKAARASGAAPTYFRPDGPFLDGGLIANNPTLDAMTEIHQFNEALKCTGQEDQVRKLGLVVSLGTGVVPVTEVKRVDVFRPDGIWDTMKLAFGMSALGQLIVDQATQANGSVVRRAQAWCNMIGVPYFRINPPISQDVALDEVDNIVLVKMLWETIMYINQHRQEMTALTLLMSR